MKLGSVDLAPLEYLIIYKQNDTLNTWTLQESAFIVNLKQMKADKSVEIIAVYKKQSAENLLDIFMN